MLFHGNMTTAALRRADFTKFWQLHLKKAPVTVKLHNFVGFSVQTMNYITNCLAEPYTAILPVVCAPGVITNKINASL